MYSLSSHLQESEKRINRLTGSINSVVTTLKTVTNTAHRQALIKSMLDTRQVRYYEENLRNRIKYEDLGIFVNDNIIMVHPKHLSEYPQGYTCVMSNHIWQPLESC